MYQAPSIKIVVLTQTDIVRTSDGLVLDGSWDFGDEEPADFQ